jgi:hypothetical protein
MQVRTTDEHRWTQIRTTQTRASPWQEPGHWPETRSQGRPAQSPPQNLGSSVSICGSLGSLRFRRLGFILDGQPAGPRHMPGRYERPPGLPGLGFVHNRFARHGRDANQMMAGGALDLPPRGLFVAFDMLLAVWTGEFELAHKPFRVDSATRCTVGRPGASRALQACYRWSPVK